VAACAWAALGRGGTVPLVLTGTALEAAPWGHLGALGKGSRPEAQVLACGGACGGRRNATPAVEAAHDRLQGGAPCRRALAAGAGSAGGRPPTPCRVRVGAALVGASAAAAGARERPAGKGPAQQTCRVRALGRWAALAAAAACLLAAGGCGAREPCRVRGVAPLLLLLLLLLARRQRVRLVVGAP
jgi:hypothetical protein